MHPKSYNFWGAYFYRMIFIWNLQIIPRLSSMNMSRRTEHHGR